MVKVVPYSNERWVPELIPVLGSQPAGDRNHKRCVQAARRLLFWNDSAPIKIQAWRFIPD